jgi:hypothetical protein
VGSRLLSPCLQHGGLPHSDINGSKVVCTSPSLFAAYRVLRRLQEPRHPPCALGLLPSLQYTPKDISNALVRLRTPVLPLARALYLALSSFILYPSLSILLLCIPSLVNELFIGGGYRIRTDDP